MDVFPVAISHYADADLADLDVQTSVGRLVDLLAPFGGRHRSWRHPVRDRGADAVQRRLREWFSPDTAESGLSELDHPAVNPSVGSSVLYWAGHGWSDGTRTALAHGGSPVAVGGSGVEPQQLAQAIRVRQAGVKPAEETSDGGGWAMVIIETSTHATQIADAVMAALHGPDAPGRLLLVAVPGDDLGPRGRFIGVLENLLSDTYRIERRILLRDLAAQLERMLGPRNVHQRALGEAALVRVYPPVASWMSAPVETISYLEDVLDDLLPDERSHFVVKAQGAEHGELSWFFEGRETEVAQISGWLHQASSGMLVVTGRAGSGKSALLGTVLVRSLPALRDALARRGLVAAPGADAAAPPESVFDMVLHLSGLNLAQAVTRVARTAGVGPLPSFSDPQAGVARDLDFLTEELSGHTRPFTVLADALDESTDPLDIARSLLARIAALPQVRILVGTRASTNEAPDSPARDENLLDALGASDVISVGLDKQAIRGFVTARLRAARDYGLAGHVIPHMREVSDEDIHRVGEEIASGSQEFLFARLAVYELIADPRLLTRGMAQSRSRLLEGTHQDLFGRALHRLAGHDDRYPVLMAALSLARGRGLPGADGIWAVVARALAAGPGENSGTRADPDFDGTASWAAAISALLGHAAAYVIADTSAGYVGPTGKGTVYRLAHRTFVEYFDKRSRPGQDSHQSRRLAAAALLRAARAAIAGSGRLPGYLVKHLSGHVAEAGMWDDLASMPDVLDRLDPSAVTTDAIRTMFGRRAVPPPIAGIIGARDVLADASTADRPGLRQLATTIHSPRQVIGEPVTGWGVAAARAGRSTLHVRLNGHTSAVNKVLSLTLPGGRLVLVSCGDDGTIRLWDPVAASPVGVPMRGHTSTIDDICSLPAGNGRTLLAGAGEDGTVRFWDPASGQPAGPVISGHAGPVWSLCVVPGLKPGQPHVLASAGSDGTVRFWDPASGQPVGPVISGYSPFLGLCAVPARKPGHSPALASAGEDGTVRFWDPVSGQPAGPVIRGHAGPVFGLCVVPGREPGQFPVLASAGEDGMVRLWDPVSGQPVAPVIRGHAGPVWSLCVVPGREPGQPHVLASAGSDGTVRFWDPASGQPAGPVISGHAGAVLGVCVVPGGGPGRPYVLASAGSDGTVRFWDPASEQPDGSVVTDHVSAILGVCAVPGGKPGQAWALASAGRHGTVRFWDPASGQPAGPVISGHAGAVLGVCVVPGGGPGRPYVLASAGSDGTVRFWDPVSGQPAGPVITAHADHVRSICVLPGREPGQPFVLASAGSDGTVRFWDPVSGQQAGPLITAGHVGGVLCICVLPGHDAGRRCVLASAGLDGTVRLWDPVSGRRAGPVITAHAGPVWSVCVVPRRGPGQAPVLVSAGEDSTVRLWDPASGQRAGPVITGHAGGVLCVCAVPGDEAGQPPILASTGSDGTVRLWDPATGQPAGPVITGHVGHVRSICVVPAREPGQPPHLASAGEDGTVRLWHAATGRAVGEPLVRAEKAVISLAPCAPALGDCVSLHGDGRVRTWIAATASHRTVKSRPDASAVATLIAADDLSLLTGDIYGRMHLSNPRTGHQPGSPLQVDQGASRPVPAARPVRHSPRRGSGPHRCHLHHHHPPRRPARNRDRPARPRWPDPSSVPDHLSQWPDAAGRGRERRRHLDLGPDRERDGYAGRKPASEAHDDRARWPDLVPGRRPGFARPIALPGLCRSRPYRPAVGPGS
ncbi:MAG TPA: hypothetical protein VFQ44_31065 [Streptosporangiaceae bacterium]|nr:hypothetical protein [Streptosporangiaceae bacterium]